MSTEQVLQFMILGIPREFLSSDAGKLLVGSTVATAVHGSTHFRSPKGLGRTVYTGASVIRFKDTIDFSNKVISGVHTDVTANARRIQVHGHNNDI